MSNERSATPDVAMYDPLTGCCWKPRNLQAEKESRTLVYIDPGGHRSVWIVGSNSAEPLHGLMGGRVIETLPDEDIFSAIRRFYPCEDNFFHAQVTPIGRFHPRIARPSVIDDLSRTIWSCQATVEHDQPYVTEQRAQVGLLMRRLEAICNVIHPRSENMNAYGHEIRNFMLLACTEVEAMWAGVLRCNGIKKDRLTTNDYVKLSGAMRLPEYEVEFSNYPSAPAFAPFIGWGSTPGPTKGIPWYGAYNLVKHRRETEFHNASLGHAFSSLAACVIMMVAQFGQLALGKENELSAKIAITKAPCWMGQDFYLPYFGRRPAWVPLSFAF